MCDDTAPDRRADASVRPSQAADQAQEQAQDPQQAPSRDLKRYPLLLIDAGNSRVKWAFRENHAAEYVRNTLPTASLLHDANREAESAAITLQTWQTLPSPQSIWISNVAGADIATALTEWLSKQWPNVPRHTIRAMATQCGVTNHYLTPERLGSDRWAGMIGARAAYPNEALLIATLGTATTLDAINDEGHFVGGLIAPGWSLMMRALGEHTAQLPNLSVGEALSMQGQATPNALPGASSSPSFSAFAQATPDAIVEGCKLAQVGLITQAWQQWRDTLETPVRCVLAGGAAADIGPALTMPHTRNDDLVLDGLAHIATQQRA